MAIRPVSVAFAASGGILLYSGITGDTVGDTIRSVLKGQQPTGKTTQPQVAASVQLNSNPAASALSSPVSGTAPSGDTSAHSSSAASNQALGKMLAAKYGWSSGPEWNALVSLWNGESGWSNTAQNPTSTAYGIAQFLDSTWAGTGFGKTSDPRIQIEAGLVYIKARYGDPVTAYTKWLSRSPHWY